MKFNMPKETLMIVRNLYSDLAFHQRHIRRIDNEIQAALMIEGKRTGSLGKEIKNINLESGEIEYGDIIKPPENKKIEVAKK